MEQSLNIHHLVFHNHVGGVLEPSIQKVTMALPLAPLSKIYESQQFWNVLAIISYQTVHISKGDKYPPLIIKPFFKTL